jgi:regulatory protein
VVRAASSSSPSAKHISPDYPVKIDSIRPHASVAAGVSVFAWWDPLRGHGSNRDPAGRSPDFVSPPRNANRPPSDRVRLFRFDIDHALWQRERRAAGVGNAGEGQSGGELDAVDSGDACNVAGETGHDDGDGEARQGGTVGLFEGGLTRFGILQDLVHRSEETFVVAAATTILARREHSAVELERKLRRKGFGAAACALAIERLGERGYQSDERFADAWVRSKMHGKGSSRSRLLAGLAQKGVDRAAAQAAVDRYEADHPDCFQAALEAHLGAAKGGSRGGDRDQVIRRLLRQGFSYGEVRKLFP